MGRKRRPLYGIAKNGVSFRGTGRYVLTPKRRTSILKAQRVSSRKRKLRAHDTVGWWLAKGVKRGASKATFGASGAIAEFLETAKASKKKRR